MRKLTQPEANACRFLSQFGDRGFCPPETDSAHGRKVVDVLNSLVRKRRAYVEASEAGPVFHLTLEGLYDA